MASYDAKSKTWNSSARPGVLNPEANIGKVVLNILSRTPEKVIQLNADTGREITCNEMKQRIVRVALNLKKLGCQKGDFVSLVCANSENVVPTFIGCLTLGMVVNPLAPVFNKDDLVHMMSQTQSRVVFCDENNREIVETAVQESINVEPNIFVMGSSEGKSYTFDQLLIPVEGETTFEPQYLGDSKKLLAMVLCSSGTTGLPKGVCLSHAHLLEDNLFSQEIHAGPIFNFSPLFWATGMIAVFTSLYFTRPRVITSRQYCEELLIEIIETYQVEDVCTPPSYISLLLSHPRFRTANFSSIKKWIITGAIVSEELRSSLVSRFPHGIARSLYGCSEIGLITSAIAPCVPGSVGILANGMVGKIVDDNGKKLGPNEVSEIRIKYKHKFLGYLNNKEATRNAFDEEDFFKTGDVGYFDENGFLFVTDRIKDIIKYHGYQISPADLESIIEKIDGVKQVCVTGVPEPDISSDLATAVIVRQEGSSLTEEQVIETVNSQVSNHKKIRGGVYFVDQLPTSAAGKVLRRVVKQILASKWINK